MYTQNKVYKKDSIAQLHTAWGERACSCKCKLPIIHPNTLRKTERERERERKKETHIKRRTYTRRISDNTDRNIQRKRKWETRIKKRTLTPTMTDNIAGDCYTYSETKREKEIRIKKRTYTRKIKRNIYIAQLHPEWADHTCSYACKLPIIYPDAETERERRIKRPIPIHVKSVTIIIAEQ